MLILYLTMKENRKKSFIKLIVSIIIIGLRNVERIHTGVIVIVMVYWGYARNKKRGIFVMKIPLLQNFSRCFEKWNENFPKNGLKKWNEIIEWVRSRREGSEGWIVGCGRPLIPRLRQLPRSPLSCLVLLTRATAPSSESRHHRCPLSSASGSWTSQEQSGGYPSIRRHTW